MNADRKTNRHNGAIARATDAAELALALQLLGQREGSPLECGHLAELLGCRAPGRRTAGAATASEGHLDTIARVLPMFERDQILVFSSALELDTRPGREGWAVVRSHDRIPSWRWHPTLETAGRAPRSEQALRFAEQVERSGIGYTITADAWRLAVFATDPSSRITGTISEFAQITGRSKEATLRTLKELEARNLITISTSGKRPIVFHVVLGVRDSELPAGQPDGTIVVPTAATIAPAALSTHTAAEPLAPTSAATEDKPATPPIEDFAIEIAPRELCFPQMRDEYKRIIEKRRAKVEFNQDFDVEEMSASAAADFDELIGKLEWSCWWQEDWVRDFFQDAIERLFGRKDLRLFYTPMRAWTYLQGAMTNRAADLVAKKRKRFGELTREQIRAATDAHFAMSEAKLLLRECSHLNGNRARPDGRLEGRKILETKLVPLVDRLAPLFDHDAAYAYALIREAIKQGVDYLPLDPRTKYGLDMDPAWSWPADVPTCEQREERAREVARYVSWLTELHWKSGVVAALDEWDGVVAYSRDGFAEWLATDEARPSLEQALELSPYADHQEAWDKLFAFAGLDARSLLGQAA